MSAERPQASTAAAVAPEQPKPETANFAPARPVSRKPMTNVDVVRLVQSGADADLVVAQINRSEPHFDLTPAAMDAMMKAGVTEDAIKAMARAQNGGQR